MKINKLIIPVVASAMLLTGCDDQIMKWGDDRAGVTSADLPLAVKEVIANYDNIKDYASQYTPKMLIGIGMGADLYCANENGEGDLANANYQLFTPGNAMKNDAIMGNSGALNFTTVDKLLASLDGNMKLYGHNFFWHTQQNQSYLKSVIAPTLVVESNSDIQTIIKNGDFETGDKTGWNSWGGSTSSEVCKEAAKDGEYGLKLINPTDGSDFYVAQCSQDLDNVLEVGKTYTIRFQAKASVASGGLQFAAQNKSDYSGEGYHNFDVGTNWTTCEYDYTVKKDGMNRILINFGKIAGTYYIDNVEFGIKKEGPTNYCDNGSFEDGTTGWTIQNMGAGVESVSLADAIDGKKALKMVASESSKNAWDLQVISPEMPTMPGKKVELSFYVKSGQAGKGRVSFSSSMSNQWPWMNWTGSQEGWSEAFETSTSWTYIHVVLQDFKCDFKDGESKWQFNLDFGYQPGVTYYIDDVKVTEYVDEAKARRMSRAGGTKMYYVLKSPEEKQAALEGVMDAWVKGVAEHLKEKGVTPYGYDVINEPIADGSNGRRGYDGVFGMEGDSEPTETEADGLNLNWGDNHWYWGYYVKDYPVKAFQLARKYLPAETKLFVNDYNLETSPEKLAALIKFAKDIDEKNGAPIVDGIGTQMHVTLSCSDDATKNAENIAALKTQVDAMFQTMAATGKLVRVTELDLSLGTKSPSSNQYKAQSDAYRMIVESYKANVPEAQQSGITIWSLSDNPVEHEYWLKDQVPNLFDADYKRKWAYKGFCDGLAGEDLGLKYGGDNYYKAYYEKNNVSSSVDK